MTLPAAGVCPWPIDPGCADGWDGYDAEVQTQALALATATLVRLTGYRISNCPVTVRPCKKQHARSFGWPLWYGGPFPYTPFVNELGLWVDFPCGMHQRDDCSCTELCEVRLPGPVSRVETVKVDGVVIDPDDYRINGTALFWTGTEECAWPTCQDLSLPDTEVGTFSVSYFQGAEPDRMAARAVGRLAGEYAAFCATGKCKLPSGVTNVVRQGVTYTLETGNFPGGMTGIREVDAFIALWNPNGLRVPPQVWSPDMPKVTYS